MPLGPLMRDGAAPITRATLCASLIPSRGVAMDPLSIQNPTTVVLRPAAAESADLGVVLARGRVVSGEVLQTFGGGSILIGIGRHRVPAQSEVEMQPGQRFLFRVAESGEQITLRLVTEPDAESELVRALRATLANALPIGDVLQELADALAADRATSRAANSPAELLNLVRAHVLEAGDDGARLTELLRTSGTSYESRLAHAAWAQSSSRELAESADSLEKWLVDAFSKGAPTDDASSDPAELVVRLRDALWRRLDAEFGSDSSTARELLLAKIDWSALGRDLKNWIARALQSLGNSPRIAHALAALRHLDFDTLTSDERELLARALVGAPLSESPSEERSVAFARLGDDLKAQLLRARDSLADGPTREALVRALGGIEAEQLLNLARHSSGEALHWSLALQDGARWTTLDLVHRRIEESESGAAESADRAAHRLTLAVDFTSTGPVRADLLLREKSLSLRVAVSRADVAERLAVDLATLEAKLASGGRSVSLSVTIAEPEDLRVRSNLSDIRFLRDHHVMDLAG